MRPLRFAAIIAGAALFAWTVRSVGVDAAVQGVARVGNAFVLVLALGGLRHFLRTVAWRQCLDDPGQLPLGAAFGSWLAGNAFGTITPFGLLVSEPSKIVLLRFRIAARDSVPALVVENLCYAGTVVLMLAAGTIILLVSFDLPPAGRAAAAAVPVGGALLVGAALWLARRRLPAATVLTRRAGRLWLVLALEASYHASAVAEIWIVIAAVTGTRPAILTAFALEYVNRTITVAFQFVPLWLGVDEAASAWAAGALGLGSAFGVSLALVRKARVLCWTAVGLALSARWATRHE